MRSGTGRLEPDCLVGLRFATVVPIGINVKPCCGRSVWGNPNSDGSANRRRLAYLACLESEISSPAATIRDMPGAHSVSGRPMAKATIATAALATSTTINVTWIVRLRMRFPMFSSYGHASQ